MSNYAFLEMLFKQDIRNKLKDEAFVDPFKRQIYQEVQSISKSMTFLPTTKESEALPDLKVFQSFTETLVHEENFFDVNLEEDNNFRSFLIDELFSYVCYSIIKTRIYNDKDIIETADKIFENLVLWASIHIKEQNLFIIKVLTIIINTSADYYKSNGKTTVNCNPFGDGNQIYERQTAWIKNLKPGDSIDYLKKSPDRRIVWVPAKIVTPLSVSGKLEIQYAYENDTHNIYNIIGVRPHRSKHTEYEWREQLKEGDMVQFTLDKEWKKYEVTDVERIKEGIILIREQKQSEIDQVVEVEIYSENLAQIDQDVSRWNQEDQEDELYLELSETKKWAIIRSMNQGSSSMYIVKYINIFGEKGGFDFAIQVINNESSVNQEFLPQLIFLLRGCLDNLVRPFILQHGRQIINYTSDQVLNNQKENLRNIDKSSLSNFIETVQNLCYRIFSQEEGENYFFDIEVKLSLICLKSNILDKQFFGAKALSNIEKQTFRRGTQDRKKMIAQKFKEEKIFDIIIKGHHTLIQKSKGILKILFSEDKVSKEELNTLWDKIVKSDTETQNSLLNVIKDIIWDFSTQEIRFFVEKMLEKANTINNLELFGLLFLLKKISQSRELEQSVVKQINQVIWKIVQNDVEMKPDFLKEVLSNFLKCIDETNSQYYLEMITKNISEDKHALRNLKILRKMLKNDSPFSEQIFEICQNSNLASHIIRNIDQLIKKKASAEHSRSQLEEKFSENEKIIIKKKLAFIDQLRSLYKDQVLVNFNDFQLLWNTLMRTGLEEKIVIDWLKKFIYNIKMDDPQKYESFFYQNIELFQDSKATHLFNMILLLFYKININKNNLIEKEIKLEAQGYYQQNTKKELFILLNNKLENLEGFNQIWELFLKNKDQQYQQILAQFITKLLDTSVQKYEEINTELYEQEREKYFAKFRELVMSDDNTQVWKGLKIIKNMILREEVQGFGQLYSFSSLQILPKQGITFEKGGNQYINIDKQTVLMRRNKTLADLRLRISKEYSIKFESVFISANNQPEYKYKHYNNSLTLENLGVKQTNQFIVKIYESQNTPDRDIDILNEQRTDFNEKFKEVLLEIFDSFSKDGKMNREMLAKFTSKATDGAYCSESDDRVDSLIKEYGNGENHLLFEGFLNFYRKSALQSESKLSTVKSNIFSLGYDSSLNLKNQQKSQQYQDFLKSSLRYKLFLDTEFFDTLLNKLDQIEDQEDFYQDICFLTPCYETMIRILENPIECLQENMSKQKWNYYMTLVRTLLFKKKKIEKILKFVDEEIDEEKYKNYLKKLFDSSFSSCIMRRMDSMKNNDSNEYQYFFQPIVLLETILKISLDFQAPDFIQDTSQFLVYYMKLKKKKRQDNDKKPEITKSNEVKQLLSLKQCLEETGFSPQQLLDTLPLERLSNNSIAIINELLDSQEDNQFNQMKEFIKLNITLLLACLYYSNDLLLKFLKDKESPFNQIILKGLGHKKQIIKIIFKNFFLYLTHNIKSCEVKKIFLNILIQSIQTSEDNTEMHLLLELASNLLNEINDNLKQQREENLNLSEIFKEFQLKLMNYKSKEVSFESAEDNTLIAIMSFMKELLIADQKIQQQMDQQDKKNLVIFLFKNCLFSIGQEGIQLESLLCKSSKSRQTSMELIIQLVKGDIKNINQLLVSGFLQLIKHVPKFQANKNSYNSQTKNNNNGLVGIRNPGCICYMNAMLQQFFYIPTFRYGILMADDQEEEREEEIYPGFSIDDNVFHQFQKMFAFLDYSQRADFNPRDFCASYKDITGQRVNVMVQQDAQEFLNVMFDKLEKSLKGSPFQGILDSVFRGKINTTFECQNCHFKRHKNEIFYNLSLEVKNLENIDESFQKFINTETISDYTCDSCKSKCDVTKTSYLQELPNVLIIHLQKIIFDLEILANVKLSSRFAFPQLLNLLEYMYKDENFQEIEEDYTYKLSGVVIHRGNANFGHYTSLVNVNRNDPNRPNKNQDEWMEFDDSKVSPFNMKNFEEECFGTKMKSDYPSNIFGMETNISKSAYILVYEKVKKRDIQINFDENSISQMQEIVNQMQDPTAYTFKDQVLETNFYNFKPFIDPKLKRVIEQDNVTLILENQLFAQNLSAFITSLLQAGHLPLVNLQTKHPLPTLDKYQSIFCDFVLKMAPQYFFQIYCFSHSNQTTPKMIEILISALIYKQEKVYQFFEDNLYDQFDIIRDIITNCNDQVIQNGLSNIIITTLTLILQRYPIDINNQHNQVPEQLHPVQLKVTQFWEGILGISPFELNDIKFNKKTDSFLILATGICHQSPDITYSFIRKNYLQKIYDLYNNSDFSTVRGNEKIVYKLIEFIYLMENEFQKRLNSESFQQLPNYPQMVNYYARFFDFQFYQKIIDEDYRFDNYYYMKKLIGLRFHDDFNKQVNMLMMNLKELRTASDFQCIGNFECIDAILKIDDDKLEEKLQMIFGIPKLSEEKIEELDLTQFVYGLERVSQPMKKVYKFYSTLDLKKSIIDILMNFNENDHLIFFFIYYIVKWCNSYQEVMVYLIKFPSYNYTGVNLLDWIKKFVENQIQSLPNSFNPPKADVFYNYIEPLSEMIQEMEKKIHFVLEENFQYSYQKSQNFHYFKEDEIQDLEINSVIPQYIIGKTNHIKQVVKKVLVLQDEGELQLNCYLINVNLMEQSTNGYKNNSLPENAIQMNSYFNRKELQNEYDGFVSRDTKYLSYSQTEQTHIKPLIDISDEEDYKKESEIEENKQTYAEVDFEGEIDKEKNYFNANYIFRISLRNKSYNNCNVEMIIENQKKNHFTGKYLLQVSNNYKELVVANLSSWNLEEAFDGLRILIRYQQDSNKKRWGLWHQLEDETFMELYEHTK